DPVDPGDAVVSGDSHRLQQVVSNLLLNAIKFTAPGGTVTIELHRADGHLSLTVTDTGVGIRSDVLPFVFDPFRQADSSSTRAHGGLGLGLAIVRNLVDRHGGTVSAYSAGTGQGAAFSVTLPARIGSEQVFESAPGLRNQPPAAVGELSLRGR